MSITDNDIKNSWGPNEDTVSVSDGVETSNIRDVDKSSAWVGTSTTPGLGLAPQNLERPTGSANNAPKVESDFEMFIIVMVK